MSSPLRFLVIDGYPKDSRDALEQAGMKLAWVLFTDMLLQHMPDAVYDIILPSDPGVDMPTAKDLADFAGIIWTGCNLTIFDTENSSVTSQISLARDAYEVRYCFSSSGDRSILYPSSFDPTPPKTSIIAGSTLADISLSTCTERASSQ